MRHILTIILFSFFSFTVLAANFNTTGWKTYLSYNNTNSVEESNDQVFVVAESVPFGVLTYEEMSGPIVGVMHKMACFLVILCLKD